MKRVAVCLGILLLPAGSMAAYLDPEVISNDGKKMVFEFRGGAGEPTRQITYVFQQGNTVKKTREWVKDTVDELDDVRSVSSKPEFQIGQVVTRLNRTAAIRAAKEVWQEKLARYIAVKDAGISEAAVELAALLADLKATYQDGFLN